MEETVSTKRVFEGRLLEVRVDEVRLPSGRVTTREIVEHPGAVAIVAADADGNLLLVRQYRKAPDQELLEIPAGTREKNEDAVDCVRRELQEETGYLARTVERLGGFFTAPGFCTEFIEIYLATELQREPVVGPEDENIVLIRLPEDDVLKLIKTGQIHDGKTIAAMMLYRLRD